MANRAFPGTARVLLGKSGRCGVVQVRVSRELESNGSNSLGFSPAPNRRDGVVSYSHSYRPEAVSLRENDMVFLVLGTLPTQMWLHSSGKIALAWFIRPLHRSGA